MTDQERKAWEELVDQAHSEPMQSAILAADAELTALRARIEVLEEVMKAAEIVMGYLYEANKIEGTDALNNLYDSIRRAKEGKG